jgi:dTDP-4-dehydrorhamnose 3,5-epimerase
MLVDTVTHKDARGEFSRLYCETELRELLGSRRIVQMNYSRTKTVGAIRGIHFQMQPCAEMKLVRCLLGRVWDVAVDIRQGSSTFLHWHAEELSPANNRMMVIPEGFAHGFQVLEPESELLYMHTDFYTPASEGGLRHDDTLLGVLWPLTPTDISQRDRSHPNIDSTFKGVAL